MPEINKVTIYLRAPSGYDPGQVSFGYYTLEGNKLTMTDGDGKPFRRASGDAVQHTLRPGDNPDSIACVLARDLRKQLHGDSAGFWRRIDWPATSIA